MMLAIVTKSTIDTTREVFDKLIDQSKTLQEYEAYCVARDIFEYCLADNVNQLEIIKHAI